MAANIPDFLTNLIAQNNPNVIFISDIIAGTYIYCSPTNELLGYDPELLIGNNGIQFLTSLIHPDDLFRVIGAYYSTINNAKPYTDDKDIIIHPSLYRIKHKSGEWKYIESHDIPVDFDENDKPKIVFGLVYDKSEEQIDGQSKRSSMVSLEESCKAIQLISPKTNFFSVREQEIIRLSIAGDTNKEIAFKLSISEQTVKNYKYQMFRKANVKNMVELAAFSKEIKL